MFAHETAGAACIRRSLRPLISEGGMFTKNFAQFMRRDREAVFANEDTITIARSGHDD
jgi:hypothetical protein